MLALQIVLALVVMSCGPILLWRRRDNVLGYLAAGVFVATYLIPLVPTLAAHRFDHATLARYADILAVGAVCFVAGLWLGDHVGQRSPNRVPLTFTGPVLGERLRLVASRTRWVALGGLVALIVAFAVMRYIPFLAADRTAAKYGVGIYRAQFLRASSIYLFGLAACGAILPVLLVLWYRYRRTRDLALALLIMAALFLTLSRDAAFTGPLVCAIAIAVERRWRPALIGALVVVACSMGALVSIAFVDSGAAPNAVAGRIAASTPDIRDHLGFVRGFEKRGEYTYGRTLLAGLKLGKGEWDPSTYALRILTGFPDLSHFASGGLRLPAPVWGYASFGWPGAAMFSAVSGLFIGWGLVKLRRLLAGVTAARDSGLALNLVLAYVFYEGTFGVLAEFYLLSSAVVVRAAVAGAVCVAIRLALVRTDVRRPAMTAAV